jgi:hypothetical protein
MKKKGIEGVVILFCGLVCLAGACFIYFTAHKIYPDTNSSRVRDLNWLLENFGKTGTAVLIAVPGLLAVLLGVRKLKNR